jgi:uncharacterized membrane protein YccC
MSAEPKTQQELLEEKLRKVEAKLTTYRSLLEEGVTPESAKQALAEAEARVEAAKGAPRFVQMGSRRTLGSDTLEALLERERHMEHVFKLRNRHPHGETLRLLRKKHRLVKELMRCMQ